jgi:hypothetical protein
MGTDERDRVAHRRSRQATRVEQPQTIDFTANRSSRGTSPSSPMRSPA